jgi:glycosyltransferase involved in cell wall biosynthesis
VIIPARDAEATIGRTLAALAAQRIDDEFEVIVVDDGSGDGTAAVVDRAPGRVRLVGQPPAGPAAARNRGVAEAGAELLAFTDADCVPSPTWLREGLAALARAELVQGSVRPDPAVSPRPFDRTVTVTRESALYETASLFCRRELFERLGGFEDWLGARLGKQLAEDVWFGWRARRTGARVEFCEAALVDHAVFRRGAGEYIGERLRLAYFPAIIAKVPELRAEFLHRGVFLNRRTERLDLALGGAALALATRSPLPAVLAAPYLRLLGRSALGWRRQAPRVAVAELAADLVGFGALVAGSVRTRSPVL